MNRRTAFGKFLAKVVISTALLIFLLPLTLQAQTGVFFVENDRVGVGVAAPSDLLHVFGGSLRIERTDGVTPNIRFRTASAITQSWLFQNNSASGVFAVRDETAGNSPFRVYPGGAESTLVLRNGNVGMGTTAPAGKLDVNGAIYQRGGVLHADYVFEPGYKLESIQEHSAFMWTEKHLPAMPKAKKSSDGREVVEIGSHRRGMLEELEKAHIYIEQLDKKINLKDSTIAELIERLKHMEKRLTDLEGNNQ